MSYLGALRLHFAGRFQAAVSTVNNEIVHFRNATFRPSDQERPQGSWNPGGDGDWRLIGCPVRSAWRGDATPVDPTDPILACVIADSDRAAPAKIVDLDPQQQLVSQIWGLEMRICAADGGTLVRGAFEPAAFFDIWGRADGPGGGDIGACAAYQSVLTGVEWGDVSASPFLAELQAAAGDGLLSVKFMLDGYTMDFRKPEFTRGRVVGTIGPASADEPRHMVRGRQFMARGSLDNFFTPDGRVNFCAAVVDEEAGKVHVDLGNALPTQSSGGPVSDIGDLSLVCGTVTVGAIDYRSDPDWYERTAGVVTLPADGSLAEGELALVVAGQADPAITEPPGGVYVRPDGLVHRLDPGEAAEVRLFATRFGQPHAGARIVAGLDPRLLQRGEGEPAVATPGTALTFPARLTAGPDGVAVLRIAAGDPGNPRDYIDGQVYGVRAALEETLAPGANYPFDPRAFTSLLVWDGFRAHDPPTWTQDLQPIFEQYANLYPVMARFLDLADYESVSENRDLLLLAFGVGEGDPNQMPVTRDLSKAKRAAILDWLQRTGPDGKPLLGPPQPSVGRLEAAPGPAPDPAAQLRGGKAAAAERRLAMRP